MSSLYAGIEAGGTKFVCGVGDQDGNLLERVQFATTTPKETLNQAIDFIRRYPDLKALGVGAFGPVCLDSNDKNYGCVMKTPKLSWQYFNVLSYLKQYFPHIEIRFDTDVNLAALAEQRFGEAQGLTDFIYITVGTGIGGGIISNNRMLHGLTHPEVGHIQAKPLRGNLITPWC